MIASTCLQASYMLQHLDLIVGQEEINLSICCTFQSLLTLLFSAVRTLSLRLKHTAPSLMRQLPIGLTEIIRQERKHHTIIPYNSSTMLKTKNKMHVNEKEILLLL